MLDPPRRGGTSPSPGGRRGASSGLVSDVDVGSPKPHLPKERRDFPALCLHLLKPAAATHLVVRDHEFLVPPTEEERDQQPAKREDEREESAFEVEERLLARSGLHEREDTLKVPTRATLYEIGRGRRLAPFVSFEIVRRGLGRYLVLASRHSAIPQLSGDKEG